jgi:hypothetical protein
MKLEKARSKTASLALVAAAYVVAVGVAAVWLVWGVSTGRLWPDTLVADVLATLVVLVFSRVYHNSSFYDAYWSVVRLCCCAALRAASTPTEEELSKPRDVTRSMG